MHGVADTMGAVRGRIFEVSFDEYVGTVNGLFNFLEILGGMVVYFMLSTPETKAQGCLRGTAYTFFFNGIFMLVSSFLSATSSYYLPTIFYYVLFNGTGSLMYIFSSIGVVRETNEVGGPPVVGLMVGGIHAFHCAYSTYKNYYD
ncbi:uncharacterized protein LOC125947106 [Dermacentor silvarum]|uniref:uncharacterized protein LOC125947106 n=1 Tax=Dermacentor silvarum TaxID=543639 RepID=UPI0021016521|nr:uncharacterized protein LOC125947106 [Dermacentor silvarum]